MLNAKRAKMKIIWLLATLVISIQAQPYYIYSQALQEFLAGNRNFGADIYRAVQKLAPGNFLVCPLSARIILSLVQIGAGGRTAQQLAAGLRLSNNPQDTLEAVREFIPRFHGTDKYTLSTANKIYVKRGFTITDQFKGIAVNVFNADIEAVNFKRRKQTADHMNAWVEEQTHGKIKNLIAYQALTSRTQAILINALYFKGKWSKPFDKSMTSKEPFFLNSKYHVVVDMMKEVDHYNYYESYELNAKFLEIIYEGNDVSMTFVLPNDVNGLSALEDRIEEVLVKPRYSWEEVNVHIPKFKIETTIKLKQILQELGIVDAFEDNADFNGIVTEDQEGLKIDQVVQKTFIEVDEEGTEAAAATYVIAVPGALLVEQPPPKLFIADHPFIYYLKSSAGGIMFIGRYVQPT